MSRRLSLEVQVTRELATRNSESGRLGVHEWVFPREMALPSEMRCIESESGEVGVHALVVGPSWRETEERQHLSNGEAGVHGLNDLRIRVSSDPRHDS